MRHPSKKLFSAMALSLALAVPGTAGAWIFSGDVLIHKLGVARRTLRMNKDDNKSPRVNALTVKGELTLSGSDAKVAAQALGVQLNEATGDLILSATASYKFPGKCKLSVTSEERHSKVLTATNKGVVLIDGGENQGIETLDMFANYACPLLDGRGGYEGPMALVKSVSIKRHNVTLGRLDKTHIAYVLGASPGQTDKSSLWIAKEIFQPARFVDRSGPVSRELRLEDYDSPLSSRWHPKRMIFIHNNKLIGTFVLESATPNPKLSDNEF